MSIVLDNSNSIMKTNGTKVNHFTFSLLPKTIVIFGKSVEETFVLVRDEYGEKFVLEIQKEYSIGVDDNTISAPYINYLGSHNGETVIVDMSGYKGCLVLNIPKDYNPRIVTEKVSLSIEGVSRPTLQLYKSQLDSSSSLKNHSPNQELGTVRMLEMFKDELENCKTTYPRPLLSESYLTNQIDTQKQGRPFYKEIPSNQSQMFRVSTIKTIILDLPKTTRVVIKEISEGGQTTVEINNHSLVSKVVVFNNNPTKSDYGSNQLLITDEGIWDNKNKKVVLETKKSYDDSNSSIVINVKKGTNVLTNCHTTIETSVDNLLNINCYTNAYSVNSLMAYNPLAIKVKMVCNLICGFEKSSIDSSFTFDVEGFENTNKSQSYIVRLEGADLKIPKQVFQKAIMFFEKLVIAGKDNLYDI